MKCKDCVNAMDEKMVNELEPCEKNDKIRAKFETGKVALEGHLARSEKPMYCAWNYLIVGSKSVCADIESMEEVVNE